MTRGGSAGAAHDHVCFAYDDDAVLAAQGRGFLAAGAAEGCEVWWIGDSPTPEGLGFSALGEASAAGSGTAPEGLGFSALGEASAAGSSRARVVRVGSAYPTGAVVDPAAQVRAYAAATDAALAAGFTGLRVMAEATPLVRSAEQLEAFCRYELLIDAYMATHPFSAMCAYDRRVLGETAIAELACLHPSTNTPAPFRLHGCAPADGAAALSGELDLTTDDLLETVLRRAPWPDDDEVVLEASGLRFADHRTLFRLDRWAAEGSYHLVLRGAGGATARVVELLGLERLRVEAVA